MYGKRDERLLRSRISSWHRRGGGFACPDCARSPRMGCEAKVVSPRKSLFCYGDFRDSIQKNHPTCCHRIDRGQSALYSQSIECRATCLPCRLGGNMRRDNLWRCESTSVGGSSSGRIGGNCRCVCRLSHKKKAQPPHA